jgi:hypothetical protein
MAFPVYPAGVQVRKTVRLAFVTTIADLDAPKIATEINAASSQDISCYTTPEGWKPSLTQNKGTAPRRVCSGVDRQVLGSSMYELPDLLYANNPQGEAASVGVLATEKLVPGTSGYIIERLGLNIDTVDYAVGQFVNVWPVTLGDQVDEYDITDEFGEYLIRQPLVVSGTGVPTRRAALTT